MHGARGGAPTRQPKSRASPMVSMAVENETETDVGESRPVPAFPLILEKMHGLGGDFRGRL